MLLDEYLWRGRVVEGVGPYLRGIREGPTLRRICGCRDLTSQGKGPEVGSHVVWGRSGKEATVAGASSTGGEWASGGQDEGVWCCVFPCLPLGGEKKATW